MSRAIVTYASGPHEELLRIALPKFEEFSRKHGYDLVVGEKLCDRPPAWNKIPLLLKALSKYDECLWFDADLVIVDSSRDFPKVDSWHAMVRHFSYLSEVPNTGVWYVTRHMIPLLELAWQLEVFTNHGWWEQAAVLTVMGYSVPPQGTLFDATKCRRVYETQWTKNCKFLPLEWNSHPNYRANKPRIVHCSYPDHEQRIEAMQGLLADKDFKYPER